MKVKASVVPFLFALLVLLMGTSEAHAEISMDRIYRHTSLREVHRATIMVLTRNDFRLVRENPSRLSFMKRSGHDGRIALTFLFRDKNGSIKVHISGTDSDDNSKGDGKLRRITERLLEDIRDKIH